MSALLDDHDSTKALAVVPWQLSHIEVWRRARRPIDLLSAAAQEPEPSISDPDAKIQVFDRGTGGLVIFTEKEWYDAALPYMPHPLGSLIADKYLEHGVVRVEYHERITTIEEDADGGTTEIASVNPEVVPIDEAQRRVDEEWRTLPAIPGLQRP